MAEMSFEEVQRQSATAGLQLVGITDVSPCTPAGRRLVRWQQKGNAGDLSYMLRNPAILSDAGYLSPAAQTLLSFVIPYQQSPPEVCPNGSGRVARYAWGRDYHRVIKKRMKLLQQRLTEEFADLKVRFFTDSVPLLERAYAQRAGAGFIGRNTMLIRPGSGSFFFIAEMLINRKIESPNTVVPKEPGGCGTCRRCIPDCPTGALVNEFELDARRCISYLTIEKRGMLTEAEREMIGNWIFGCDICQEVCPFNHRAQKLDQTLELKELSAEAGCGPHLSLEPVLRISTDRQFIARFAGTALMRAKREGLLRNAAVVAANTGAISLLPVLLERAKEDESEVVRAHSLWAAARFYKRESGQSRARKFVESFLADPSSIVKGEAVRLLERKNDEKRL